MVKLSHCVVSTVVQFDFHSSSEGKQVIVEINGNVGQLHCRALALIEAHRSVRAFGHGSVFP